jgi:hypothetical protein
MIPGKTKKIVESQKHQLLKWMKKVTAFALKLTFGRMIRAASTRVLTLTQVNCALYGNVAIYASETVLQLCSHMKIEITYCNK